MVTPVLVTIVGAPVACGAEVKDTWRELSRWAATQLRHRYGDAVLVEYHDLFDADCPSVPADAELPLVLVADDIVTSGGKLSLPSIRRAVEALGVQPGDCIPRRQPRPGVGNPNEEVPGEPSGPCARPRM